MAYIQATQAGYNSFVIDTADGNAQSGGAFQGGGSKDKGAGVLGIDAPTAVNSGTTSDIGPVAVGAATGTVLAQLSNPS